MFDVDDERNPEEKKNGFVFDDANEGVSTLNGILKSCVLSDYRSFWDIWEHIVKLILLTYVADN